MNPADSALRTDTQASRPSQAGMMKFNDCQQQKNRGPTMLSPWVEAAFDDHVSTIEDAEFHIDSMPRLSRK